ncbi:MAG: thrombospondin type 3 repeat-containing protein [bacterium]
MELETKQEFDGVEGSQLIFLNKNQKIAVVFLSLFFIGVVIYFIYQLRSNLNSAIDYSRGDKRSLADVENVASSSDAYLKSKDSDKDGLSDWDELNLYETSPFLSDTDSDGISDFDEVKAGTNPKCREGQNCNEVNFLTDINATGTPVASKSAGDIFSDEQKKQMAEVAQLADLQSRAIGATTTTESGSKLSTDSSVKTSAATILNGKADASSLRKELLNSGMSEADLNKISDEVLMKSYQDILNKK